MSGGKDPRGANPERRQPLCIDGTPHSAEILEIASGFSVAFLLDGRRVGSRIFDMPLHVLADRVHDIVTKANRGSAEIQRLTLVEEIPA